MPWRRSIGALLGLAPLATAAAGVEVPVSTAGQLIAAIDNAAPGHVITLAPGTYEVGQNLLCDVAGTDAEPIVVRAAALGDATIRFDAVEGFKVSAPRWTFENLDIRGVCPTHSDCEHAFHLFGDADRVDIRGSRLREYNAAIKSNIGPGTGGFPDDVVVEFNELYNSTIRDTANPVTPIDVVGGRRWIVRANLIADFAKGGGNGISYAAFLKGNSKDGLFERNLVICERSHSGGIRLGLSFGGGGSGPASICEEGTCTPEHEGGLMRNNIIINCPADVGIYLNEAKDVKVYNNTLFDSTGIDVRFTASVADLRNNILSGQIRERDGGTATAGSNLESVADSEFAAWFTDPAGADFGLLDGTAFVDLGETLADVPADYCASPRDDGATDIGPLEYVDGLACDTTLAGGVGTGGDPPCPFPPEVHLANLVISGTEVHEACDLLTAGPAVTVAGDATLRAGNLVALDNGFVVASAGRLTVAAGAG